MQQRDVPQGGGIGIDFTIRIEGVFDVEAAMRLRASLVCGEPGDSYGVDLSRVSRFDDGAVALLAATLRGRGMPRVSVRGLRRRQLQLLCHLASGAAAAAPATQG